MARMLGKTLSEIKQIPAAELTLWLGFLELEHREAEQAQARR